LEREFFLSGSNLWCGFRRRFRHFYRTWLNPATSALVATLAASVGSVGRDVASGCVARVASPPCSSTTGASPTCSAFFPIFPCHLGFFSPLAFLGGSFNSPPPTFSFLFAIAVTRCACHIDVMLATQHSVLPCGAQKGRK